MKFYYFFIILFSFSINSTIAQSRLKAEIYAQNAAEQIKEKYTPFTGSNVRSTIEDMEFDYSENEYVIKMTAYWDARGCMFCSTKLHSISGILIFNTKSKNTQFKTTNKNSAVIDTEGYISATGFVIGALVTLSRLE